MHRYKDLTVWQKAMELVVKIYKITEKIPFEGAVWIDLTDEQVCNLHSVNHCGRSREKYNQGF